MTKVPTPDTEAQRKYQAIKAGTFQAEKKRKMQEKLAVAQDLQKDIAECSEIGDQPLKKTADMLTVYEAEAQVPAEYKKCFKMMANGGWSAMAGRWPCQGQTVLHWAARNGKDELCRFIMEEYHVDAHEEDGSGHSAIYHAKLKRHRRLAKKLISKFRDENARERKKKMTDESVERA